MAFAARATAAPMQEENNVMAAKDAKVLAGKGTQALQGGKRR